MSTRQLFATPLYEGRLDDDPLVSALARSSRQLAKDDRAGQQWCVEKGYPGYTSYASLNDLDRRDPDFGQLKRLLDKHAKAFAADCAFDLGRAPNLDSLWVNILRPGGTHSGHIHPGSIISGTLYLETPSGSGSLKLEDPRLGQMMAAPARREDGPEHLQPFVYVDPKPGMILMWESWLRHEVVAGTAKRNRLSISFNYR